MIQKQKKLIGFQLSIILVVLFFSVSNFSFKQETFAKNSKPEIFSAPTIQSQKENTQGPQIADDQIIIKYRKNKINLESASGRKKADGFVKNKQIEKTDTIEESNIEVIKTSGSYDEKLTELKNDPDVEFAQPNYKKFPTAMTTNDPIFLDPANPQWYLKKIKAPEAWSLEASAQTPDTIVAVIDNGIYYNHQDLISNMWDGTLLPCIDDNSLLIVGGCPNHGWDYKTDGTNDNNPIAEPDIDPQTSVDSGLHGTRVAGMFGTVTNNSLGLSGISRNNNLKIMAIRFGYDTISEIKAINFAEKNGAKVINASFGGPDFSQAEKDAIASFSGIVVASAGNAGTNNELIHDYPSDYDNANIISVAASDQNDALAQFSETAGSNYGAISVDIAAPGISLISTYYDSNTTYVQGSAGTSLAAPFVAGGIALLANKFPTLTNTQLKNIILTSGDTLPNPLDAAKISSGKRLNLENAFLMADLFAPSYPTNLAVN